MKALDRVFLDDLGRRAAASPRRRQHFNLHASHADPCQRLVNYLWGDSYIRPHRHSADPKPETLIALQGAMGCIGFDDSGAVTWLVRFGAGADCSAIVVEPDEWHTVVALSDTAILFEVKAGPFDPWAAKESALWATEEGSETASAYLLQLQALFD
ncbi:WbuC family cupin fold metalloprotein [Sphingopyxis sp. MG]|uniref:WbuC family cupin fold metalloprotein n=1 Tax=Sphingopyxis sp. MG TaxID=1866325 RepID=UPI000CDF3DEA|nr:WbuC family cupin fold metalloprotein [Sphingopyxis sp. MG]AVA13636.1 cupin fold metalloprotein, WbuC family [Sphingopyxis sp. MG]